MILGSGVASAQVAPRPRDLDALQNRMESRRYSDRWFYLLGLGGRRIRLQAPERRGVVPSRVEILVSRVVPGLYKVAIARCLIKFFWGPGKCDNLGQVSRVKSVR